MGREKQNDWYLYPAILTCTEKDIIVSFPDLDCEVKKSDEKKPILRRGMYWVEHCLTWSFKARIFLHQLHFPSFCWKKDRLRPDNIQKRANLSDADWRNLVSAFVKSVTCCSNGKVEVRLNFYNHPMPGNHYFGIKVHKSIHDYLVNRRTRKVREMGRSPLQTTANPEPAFPVGSGFVFFVRFGFFEETAPPAQRLRPSDSPAL